MVEPTSPALAGEFLTTGPPGKPYLISSCMGSFFVVFFLTVYPSPSPCSVNVSEICLLGQLLGKGCNGYGGAREAGLRGTGSGDGCGSQAGHP